MISILQLIELFDSNKDDLFIKTLPTEATVFRRQIYRPNFEQNLQFDQGLRHGINSFVGF